MTLFQKVAGPLVVSGAALALAMLAGCGSGGGHSAATATAVASPGATAAPTPGATTLESPASTSSGAMAGSPANVSSAAPAPALTIGRASAGSQTVQLDNATGKVIKAVSIRGTGTTKWTELAAKVNWAQDVTATIIYPAIDPAKATSAANGNNFALKPQYDIRIALAGRPSTAVLYSLDLSSLTTAQVMWDAASSVPYLSYTDSGATVTTLQAEKAMKAQADADAAKQRATKKPTTTAPPPAAPAPPQNPPAQGGGGGGSVSQTGGGCLDSPKFN
ncbi:MAG: hypothetical protein FWD74_00035 [Actinomycetia bacterium]|nr:hypothetical protein [Actinomycetes bacterium]